MELLESDDRICATEADALGIEPVISRCAGGLGTKSCLDSLVLAACSAVERAPGAVKSREETVHPSERESTLQNGRIGREPAARLASGCHDDGAVRWVRSTNPTDATRGVTLASVACDRVCRTPFADSVVAGSNPPPFRETRTRRVEVDVRCEGERRCEVSGPVRWFAAGSEADGRRAELEQAAKPTKRTSEDVHN